MQISSFFGVLATLPLFHGMATAGCNPVGRGDGNNPLRCKSYNVPNVIGQSTVTDFGVLTITKVAENRYDIKNNNGINNMNFIVQRWDAPKNKVRMLNILNTYVANCRGRAERMDIVHLSTWRKVPWHELCLQAPKYQTHLLGHRTVWKVRVGLGLCYCYDPLGYHDTTHPI